MYSTGSSERAQNRKQVVPDLSGVTPGYGVCMLPTLASFVKVSQAHGSQADSFVLKGGASLPPPALASAYFSTLYMR